MINGTSSVKVQTGLSRLGSNGSDIYGIFAPLIAYNLTFDSEVKDFQSIKLKVTIDEHYGGGYAFASTSSITASILYNTSISDDFSEISLPNGAFNEDISWFTDRGWIDTGVNYFFPAGSNILEYGTTVTADITTGLKTALGSGLNHEFAFLVLADNYNGTWLKLGQSGSLREPELEIDYNAVPEPSAYALLIGGLALSSILLRRRIKA